MLEATSAGAILERPELFDSPPPRGANAAHDCRADAPHLRPGRVGLSGQHVLFSFESSRVRAQQFGNSKWDARARNRHGIGRDVPAPGEIESGRQNVRPGFIAEHGGPDAASRAKKISAG